MNDLKVNAQWFKLQRLQPECDVFRQRLRKDKMIPVQSFYLEATSLPEPDKASPFKNNPLAFSGLHSGPQHGSERKLNSGHDSMSE
jgi:hypothetical protein